jgi:membrane-associated phospholipid phosphatase
VGLLTSTATAADPLPSPIDDLGEHTLRAFGPWTWVATGAGIASTAAMAASGADHEIRVAFQTGLDAPAWGTAAFVGGYVLPAVVLPGLYVSGVLAESRTLAGSGSAAVQAVVLTVLTTGLLKVASGRPFPRHGADPNAPDHLDHPEWAREFVPFSFAGRYAWPSGHTSSMFSLAAALTAYDPDNIAVPLVAYPIALGVGAGMIAGDSHWASDVVAGGLLGQAIGWSVGRSFAEGRDAGDPDRGGASSWQLHWVPLVGGLRGIAVVGVM